MRRGTVLEICLSLGEMDVAAGHRDVPMAEQPLNLGQTAAGDDGGGADAVAQAVQGEIGGQFGCVADPIPIPVDARAIPSHGDEDEIGRQCVLRSDRAERLAKFSRASRLGWQRRRKMTSSSSFSRDANDIERRSPRETSSSIPVSRNHPEYYGIYSR